MKLNYILLFVVGVFLACAKDDCDSDHLTICELESNGLNRTFTSLIEETNFDGMDQNVVDLGAFYFYENTDFTFVGQVNASDLRTFGRIWDFGPENDNFRFHHNINNTARVAVGSFDYVLNVENFWELNTWIDVAVQYSSKVKELKLYKNGQLVGSLQDVIIPPGLRDNLIIGGSNWSGNFPTSPEPNTIMKTRNFHFYFTELSEECMAELLKE
jgi:hypothetical protein